MQAHIPHGPVKGVKYTGSGIKLPIAKSKLNMLIYHTAQCREYITQAQVEITLHRLI